ncbi:MAG: class I SAM-dependent methyltransferase [Clostridia bacterium]|nr:class I SAM-dependent methyltransferase [Clostridia bacterium]
MDCYNDFAYVYDKLVDDVDYNEFLSFFEKIFEMNNLTPELILELGCGTGNFTEKLVGKGYDVIALDSSEQMLGIAQEKLENVLFLNQDMTDFELYGTVDAIVCVLDGINYITNKRKLLKLFKLCHNYLNYGGMLIFDINSEYKLKNIIGNNTFVGDNDDVFYVWENQLLKDRVNFYLTFFAKDKEGYNRFDEVHTERIYSQSELLSLLKKANFEDIKVYADFDVKKPNKKSQRLFVCAKKNAK